MSRTAWVVLALSLVTAPSLDAHAQLFKPSVKVPNAEALSAGRKSAEKVFQQLGEGKTEEIATWIVSELGRAWSVTTKGSRTADFRSKLDIVLLSPPEGVYGKLDGYDLIDESYLPGSDRYFRFVYATYHVGSLLIWEFRFYVNPDGGVNLHHLTWSEMNPFEYLSTGDMLLPRWYD